VGSRLLLARVALLAVLAGLVFVPDGGAVAQKQVIVALTASHPSPSRIKKGFDETLAFVNTDSVSHTVFFVGGHCTLVVPPGSPEIVGHYECLGQAHPGTYHYLVDDRFRGTVAVVGLFRALTLTARTHMLKLGSRLQLNGHLRFDNQGALFCAEHMAVRVFARVRGVREFKRIATLYTGPRGTPSRAGKRGCTYAFRLAVRPGVTTSYVAKASEEAWLWKQAASRRFTVQVRAQ
jgi:hypothetical protein